MDGLNVKLTYNQSLFGQGRNPNLFYVAEYTKRSDERFLFEFVVTESIYNVKRLLQAKEK
ncbi:hypothetical protein [Sulfolobus acidocaldarius]|uniref:Uncharacterized protein n=1 Tax=Sulfolobus acidocaldarius TaxID=2285 RepID=A0A0U3FV95_9CREN|nr:hypothetical protein [Sulfolobus acidocaldarius]ALU28983.1 hypothetical protein ATY89_02785 [Sulfolobus acidocaldarius]ALU31710.1 hypothetical protein ATZ20_05810 [Sulfolobus acidocaldarius]WCM34649.1 hypothetical protein GO597_04530 [Sulfolobus acidocaldarius DSM 639]